MSRLLSGQMDGRMGRLWIWMNVQSRDSVLDVQIEGQAYQRVLDEWMGRLWIDCFIAHWMKRGMDGWINDWIMNSLFRGINKELDKYSGEWIMDRVING